MYNPTTWKDRIVEYPRRIKLKKQNGTEETVEYEPMPGVVVEEGTPLNAEQMQKIEDGLKNHELSEMPHVMHDEDNNKKYRYGFRFKNGGMQLIYEEVI